MRIVSLLPSATEIVCALGLRDQLVGVSHECDFPADVRTLPKVTKSLIPAGAESGEIDRQVREHMKVNAALYSLDYSSLEQLQPDLLITQTLCDVCAVSAQEVDSAVCLLPGQVRVVNLEPTRLTDVMAGIQQVGEVAGVPEKAREVIAGLDERIANVARVTQSLARRPRVILLEWIDPPFCSGHWSPELVRIAGGIEEIGRDGHKSRTLDWDEIMRCNPEELLIACCGFDVERTMRDIPLLSRNPRFRDLTCVQSGNIHVIDGNAYFNRPGPRLVDGLDIIAHALHPYAHTLPPGLPAARRVTRLDY